MGLEILRREGTVIASLLSGCKLWHVRIGDLLGTLGELSAGHVGGQGVFPVA